LVKGEKPRLRDALQPIACADERRSGMRDWSCAPRDGYRSWGWQPRQPHPGTRIIHYRCCLPALAEFANYRRERTDGAAIERGGNRW